MIYLEGENAPYTVEKLADRIMQSASKLKETQYNAFTENYEDIDFTLLSSDDKVKKLLKDFTGLKKKYQRLSCWNDTQKVKSDIIGGLNLLQTNDDGKIILFEHLLQLHIIGAVKMILLKPMRNYFNDAIGELQRLVLEEEDDSSLEALTVGQILKILFRNPKLGMLNKLENKLAGKEAAAAGTQKLTYIGTKKRLYRHLGILIQKDFNRSRIATVISTSCLWQANENSHPTTITYEEIYRKI